MGPVVSCQLEILVTLKATCAMLCYSMQQRLPSLSLVSFVINKYTQQRHPISRPHIPAFFYFECHFSFSFASFFHHRAHRLQSLFRQEQFVKQKFTVGDVVGFCERREYIYDKSRVRLKEVDV